MKLFMKLLDRRKRNQQKVKMKLIKLKVSIKLQRILLNKVLNCKVQRQLLLLTLSLRSQLPPYLKKLITKKKPMMFSKFHNISIICNFLIDYFLLFYRELEDEEIKSEFIGHELWKQKVAHDEEHAKPIEKLLDEL